MNSELWRTAQRLLALARSGLAYSPAPYDRERYEEIEQTALRLLEREAGFPEDSLRAALPRAIRLPSLMFGVPSSGGRRSFSSGRGAMGAGLFREAGRMSATPPPRRFLKSFGRRAESRVRSSPSWPFWTKASMGTLPPSSTPTKPFSSAKSWGASSAPPLRPRRPDSSPSRTSPPSPFRG